MSYARWEIREDQFPLQGSMEDKIRFWLQYAILAPSAHNTQPWRFLVEDGSLKVYRDEEHTLKRGDPTLRETTLSLGACIENFCIAAAHWNFATQVSMLAHTIHDMHVATIQLSPVAQDTPPNDLFSGILQRHTNRGEYESSPLEDSIVSAIRVKCEPETEIFLITQPDSRARIARLVGLGTVIALGMPTMQRELAELVYRINENPDTGMVVEALTESPPLDLSGKDWVLTSLDPHQQGQEWETAFATSPLHVIIATLYDGPEAWLAAGRVMERLLVAAAKHNLAHCIAAAPIEIPTLTPDLRKEIPEEYRPQVLVRLGFPKNKAYSVESGRRAVNESSLWK